MKYLCENYDSMHLHTRRIKIKDLNKEEDKKNYLDTIQRHTHIQMVVKYCVDI